MQGDKKLEIYYTAQKGKSLSKHSFTVMVTAEQFAKTMENCMADLYAETEKILKSLIKMQGYDKLYDYGIEFEVELPDGKHICKYCGGLAEGTFEDLLCGECRETFGHSLYSEL